MPMALAVPPSIFHVHIQFNLIYQFWIHTELVRTIGPLEYILNTPSHHRVHHGKASCFISFFFSFFFFFFFLFFFLFFSFLSFSFIFYSILFFLSMLIEMKSADRIIIKKKMLHLTSNIMGTRLD